MTKTDAKHTRAIMKGGVYMPKSLFKNLGKTLMILGGGFAVGYLKCLKDVKKKYGDVIEDEEITVKPCKGMTVSITNSTETEES